MTAVLAILVFAVSFAARRPARPWIQLGIPLVVCAEMFLVGPVHDLACGVVVTAALALAAAYAAYPLVIVAAGVFLMRWMPFSDVLVWREVVVLLGAFAVASTTCHPERSEGPGWGAGARLNFLHRADTPSRSLATLGMTCAIAVATVTPIIPRRGMLFPFAIAALSLVPGHSLIGLALIAIAPFVRYSYAAMLIVGGITLALPLIRRLPVVPQTAAIALFALWPWSGLLARSFPAFLRVTPVTDRVNRMDAALAANESYNFDVAEKAQTVIVTASGARAERMREGRVLGTIDVSLRSGAHVKRDIRIGDVADFGFMRREQFFRARNPAPAQPADDLRGTGATSWLWGGGRVTVRANGDIASVRVTAARDLPSDSRLRIEAIDFE